MTARRTNVPQTEAPLLPGHDGIQEYDNPIPGWMSWILGLTIVWSGLYLLYFHAGNGESVAAEYQNSLAENIRKQFAEIGNLKADEPTILAYMGKPDWVAFGRSIFQSNCQSCHGPTGLGAVGTNLCDDHYKNVNTLPDIAKIVAGGANGNAMPAWAGRLHPNEIVLVSSYVATLRGSGSGGKAPEGKVIPPWPAVPVAPKTPAEAK
jgi:cytochrome c oxidase cbb3-type subunit 3